MIDIGTVARETGLTLRALRYYESRGLIAPLRTAGGRRVYGARELARLNAIVTLKRAGFPIANIERILGNAPIDLARLIATQIAAIDTQTDAISAARTILRAVLDRIDRGEAVDVVTLCRMVRQANAAVATEHWKAVTDRYFTPAEKREWNEHLRAVPDAFGQEAYGRQWKALAARIEAALPLDPRSPDAQAFVDAWFALLKPFSNVATPAMWNGAARLYGDMAAWEGKGDPGFSQAVWDFISAATRARLDAGGTIDGPAWMNGSPMP